MGLRAKFNMAVLAALIVGLGLAGVVLQMVTRADARQEVVQNARIMLETGNAIREYTAQQIGPAIAAESSQNFLPISIPFFAAQTNFKAVQKKFPNFTYKEAALNPTNLSDRASDWEADIIQIFRNDPGRIELITERDTPNGRILTLARPIMVEDQSCLSCHSSPSNAPPSMVRLYGNNNGFGWKMNETVGAQVVSVPMSVPIASANQTFVVAMAILVAIFILILAILNILLHFVVIKPVVRISKIASDVSLGDMSAEEYVKPGRDEISSLTASFARMRRSLESAMKLLEG
ncbi:MAG: signal protein [Rhodospirillales bacterium]|nr:signal protein [Rhodospirillales bacterium]